MGGPTPDPARGREQIAAAVAVMALVAGAALWLRLSNLDGDSLFADEYLHVHAAQQLIESGEPRLPSGRPYSRALPYTRLVEASFRAFGVSEWSARLPSALAGTLVVLATFAVGWRWFGPWSGVVAGALVAFGPPVLATARFCRMYSSFELLYLAALFAYERGWEPQPDGPRRRLGWKIAGPAVLVAAYTVHLFTVNFLAALGVYWVAMVVWTRERRYATYLLGAAAAALAAAAAGVADPEKILALATADAPDWGRGDAGNVLFYARAWALAYPWLWWSLPFAVGFACLRHGRKAFLLLCLFGVPMLLHSLAFTWKAQRYVSYLFPLAALLVAPLAVWGMSAVLAALRDLWVRLNTVNVVIRGLAVLLAAEVIGLVAALAVMPSVSIALALRRDPHEPNWRAAFAHVAAAARPDDALLTSSHLSATYYLPRQGVQLAVEAHAGSDEPSARQLVVVHDAWHGSVDVLREAVARHPRGWLVTAPNRLHNPNIVAPAVRRHVESTLHREPLDVEPAVLVFRWGESAPATDAPP